MGTRAPAPGAHTLEDAGLPAPIHAGVSVTARHAIALLAFFGWTRGFVPDQAAFLAIPAGLAAGVFTLLRFCLIAWRRRRESA